MTLRTRLLLAFWVPRVLLVGLAVLAVAALAAA
jgi:hypothetical protein